MWEQQAGGGFGEVIIRGFGRDVVESAPTETETLSRFKRIKIRTRPGHLEFETKTRPRFAKKKITTPEQNDQYLYSSSSFPLNGSWAFLSSKLMLYNNLNSFLGILFQILLLS